MKFFSRWLNKSSSEMRFAELAMEVLQETRGPVSVTFDTKLFALVYEADQIVFLDAPYRESQHLDELDQRQCLRSYFQTLQPIDTAGPSIHTSDESHILPRIRHMEYIYHSALRYWSQGETYDAQKDHCFIASDILPEHLTVQLVYDGEKNIVAMRGDNLDKWQRSKEELYDTALSNLAGRSAALEWEEPAPGLFVSAFGDQCQSSRMLLPEVIREVAVKGRPVAVPLSRNQLWLTGDEDAAGLAALAERLTEPLDIVRIETCVPMVLGDDNRWSVLPLVATTVHAPLLRRLAMDEWKNIYNVQRTYLKHQFAASNNAIRVASFDVQEFGERFYSICVWTQQEALLPKTDLIAFHGTGHAPMIVPWEEAADILQTKLNPTELWPARYETLGFPDKGELRLLFGKALPGEFQVYHAG